MIHNLYIALICISVVFIALLILYCIYSIIGAAARKAEAKALGEWVPRKIRRAMRKAMRKMARSGKPDTETAAAIAMALDAEMSADTEVAIATALALQLGASVHDEESGIITIRPTASAWANKSLTFRRLP